MKQITRLTNVLLWSLLLTGCSFFGGDDDDAAIEPAAHKGCERNEGY